MTPDQTKLSIEHCLERVAERPESATAHFNLGLAYSQRGMVTRAEVAYRKAVELDPDRVEAWVNLGGALMLQWDFQGSIEANEQALKRKEDLLLAHFNTGQAHLYLGDAEETVRCNRRVVDLDPNHGAGHYYLAVGLLALDRLGEAREEATRARFLGHSPDPKFLQAMDVAEKKTESKSDESTGENLGADAPTDS